MNDTKTPNDAEASPMDDLIAGMREFADDVDRHGHMIALGGHARMLRSAADAMERREPPSPWYWSDTRRPDAGRRVLTLYEDGSGSIMGCWTGEVLIDQDGHDQEWREEPGAMWCYLPKGYSLWCETREEDPFTFPDDVPAPTDASTGRAP